MHQTLLVIPRSIGGIDVFGFGWLLALWAVAAAAVLAWSLRRYGWGAETRGQLPVLLVVGLVIAFLLPRLVDADAGGLPIRGYGVMLLVSVAAGIGVTLHRARQIDLDPEIILSLATWCFVAGIVGARLFYVIEYWPKFNSPTLGQTLLAVINLTQGGLVVYGSLLAGGAALVAFVYKHHLPGLALADLVAPGVVLGVGLGRIGCFLNGCCYGGTCELPWAVQFPAESPAYMDQAYNGKIYIHGLVFKGAADKPAVIERVEPGSPAAEQGLKAGQQVVAVNGTRVKTVDDADRALLRTFGAGTNVSIQVAGDAPAKTWRLSGEPPRSLPVHPTQLYSLIDALLLFFFLLAYEPFQRRDGELVALVLTIHPVSRFLLEIVRVDEGAVFNTGMSISQNISIAIFVGGILLWTYLLRRRPRGSAWGVPVVAGRLA
jgi:phosphatidylglycerol:prolipoprotein diacylglycerol transferase